jgi:protein tyrosine phosphatase (PTP) superfamily phosphohydrolase (DUF442 family)
MHRAKLAVRGVLVFAFAVELGLPVAAQAPDAQGASRVIPAISQIRIANFGRISATYYRGSQPEGRDYGDLASLGVRTVINLADDGQANERALVERAGMTYVQIPMTTHDEPTAAQLSEFLRIVNDPQNQPVYVHCIGGKHRTGVMTAVYRMSDEGWTADRAFAEMKAYKFGADFLHPEFKRFVYAYRVPQPAVPQIVEAAKSNGGDSAGAAPLAGKTTAVIR